MKIGFRLLLRKECAVLATRVPGYRIGIETPRPQRQCPLSQGNLATPTGLASLHLDAIQLNVIVDEISLARKAQRQMMTMRAKFQFDIAVIWAGDEDLHDLVVPKAPQSARRFRGSAIAVVGRIDRNPKAASLANFKNQRRLPGNRISPPIFRYRILPHELTLLRTRR